MSDARVMAYLTSAYGRTSDLFIREEVKQLRALGNIIYTFSIRRPDESHVVSKDILRERSQTEYVLVKENAIPLIASVLKVLCRSPLRLLRAIALAVRCSNPGLKSRIWALAYVIEACFLAERLRFRAASHLHNHFGEGSATVAMLTGLLLRIPYSLTIHGSGEFDHPKTLALDEKIARASFVVAVSDWGRSQLLRWCRPESNISSSARRWDRMSQCADGSAALPSGKRFCARAFVLPSFAENLPVAIMEALALGRPVISTHLGGIPELVSPGVGWLVPPGSAPALAEALRQAVTATPQQLEKMGKAGAALVAARHNSRVGAAKLARLIADGGSAQERQVVPEVLTRQPQAIR